MRSARDRDPSADAGAVEAHERQRLAEFVRALLPPTPRAEDRRVTITRFPDGGARRAAAAPPSTRPPGDAQPPTGAGRFETLTAALRALREGRPGDVPREAWLVVIAIAAAVLASLVLRGPAATAQGRRRRPDRIDWSGLETPPADDRTEAGPARRVAA